jgi:glycosyltransferase involved in cell wall biosynthesis
MQILPEIIDHHMRDLYWESPALQNAYSSTALAAARMAESVGMPGAALEWYCSAARRVRDPGLRRRRLQPFSGFLARTFRESLPQRLGENPFIASFLRSKEAGSIAKRLRTFSPEDRLSLRKNVIVLKAPTPHERGVVLVKYTPHFNTFLVNFDLHKVSERFAIVLEPSWYPYPEPFWAHFTAQSPLLVCQTISQMAAEDMGRCGLPLVPVAIGAQDWVNPEVFFPIPGTTKDFDVVMIASFMKLKRHAILFRAMRKMRPRRIKVALIGRTWGRNRQQFEQQVREAGVADDVTIFQGLKGPEINQVLNRSKVNLLLSKVEGGNVALMEAIAAGVPCVVYKDIIGPRLSDINEETGLLSGDDELHHVLPEAIDRYAHFRPREWFLRNTGPHNSTRKLDEVLRMATARRGEEYRTPIVGKENRLGLHYLNQDDEHRMNEGWHSLAEAVRPL